MAELKPIIEQSFIQYAGAVLQSRALVDVRDGLKPSARQIFYSMLLHKLTNDKPYKKTANAVGMAMADFYIHGDSSCEGVIMRAGQPFAMRYPIVDVKGNAGTLIESGNWAAMRYTESRLSKISNYLFADIDKNVIEEWRDSYDNTKQYPAVLSSKGFYNIVNGTQGIGIGMASSVPQYNLRELNNALIYLIDNPDCEFEDIYCAPDFATGAILYNENEVKESMKKGVGKACKLRSIVEFDSKDRCFVVTEIPYGVYTNTICGQLEEIINSENNPGLERFNDLTGEKPLIKIYLSKKANPDKVLKYLFKNTSLQSYYGINFTMLDNGRFPRVFTWKEMLQAHIDHEKIVYRRGFEYDLNKIEKRIHIIDGLLKCLAQINEVVTTIKASTSTAAAALALQSNFLLDEIQAKSVLEMKLSRLAHLEVEKLINEREDLTYKADHIEQILNDDGLFKEELKNGWREVSRIFGDNRRTKIIQMAEDDNNEPIEEKQLSLSFTNAGAVYVSETSTLYSQRRNGYGTKFKLDNGEYIIDNIVGQNTDTILFFTNIGNFYPVKMGEFIIGEKQYLNNFITLRENESIVAAAIYGDNDIEKYIIFITKDGYIKKSKLSEYNLNRKTGALAIKLNENDTIISILFTNDDNIGILTKLGFFINIESTNINAIGRVARGVIGIKLNEGDQVVSAHCITKDNKYLFTCNNEGTGKITEIKEYPISGRATKGRKIQKGEQFKDFLPLNTNQDILIISTNSQIRFSTKELPLVSRDALGCKLMKLLNNSIVKIQALNN